MTSDHPQMGSPIIDPVSALSTPTTYDYSDSLVGTESQNSRSESVLLPDSPLSATDSLGEIWLPRLSGGRKRLHYGGRTLASEQAAGNVYAVGTPSHDAGNLNNWQDESILVNPTLPVSTPRSVVGRKAFKKSNRHLGNHKNVNYTWPRKTGRTKGPEESIKEENDDCEENSLTGCEYESDDLLEDISHGLAYGQRKQPTSTSSHSSDEYAPDTVNEFLSEIPQDQTNNYSHRSSIHEPASNITIPENLAVAEKVSRFKILGKNGFFTSWKKATKTVNLEEKSLEDIIPRNRHYEGCILCPPHPSPRSSVTSTVGAQELYAPSGQNAGPPPLVAPPFPPGHKDIKGKSPAPQEPLLAPTSYNVMKDLLGKHDKVGQPGPSNYYQGASNNHIPFNSYHTYLDRSSNSSNDSGNLGGPSNQFDQPEEGINTGSRSLNIRMELSPGNNKHAVENNTDGNYDGDPHQESQEDSHNRTKGIIKRRPLSSRPLFLGKRSSRGLIRLPDGSGGDPHPGTRRDHQYLGADGIYEMVDIEPLSTSAIAPNFHTGSVRPIQHARTRRDMQTRFMRFKHEVVQYLLDNWKIASAVAVVVSVLLTMILLLLIIIPNIMRSKADRTTFEVTALHISDISHNYTTVTLDLRVISNAGTRININPTSFSFESDNDYNYDFYHSKKEDSKNKSELYRGKKYTPIGDLYLDKDLSFSKGNGNMFLTSEAGDNNHNSNDNKDIARPGFWRPADMVEILVWGAYNNGTGMRSVIQGDVQVQARGFATWVDIKKEINIYSMGGFQDLKIDSYEFLQPQKGFIDANISWFNPSIVTMNMGNMDFDLFLGDLPIGDAKISSMKIFPGYNHAHFSSSLFDRDIFRNNKTLLGELISSLSLEEVGSTREKLLHLNGRNTTFDGNGIGWLQPIIQLFDKDLPVAINEQIFSAFNTSILLTMTPDGKTKLKRGSIQCKLELPFESEDFLITIRGVGYFLDISLPQNDAGFLRIESTMNSHDQTVLSRVHTFNSSLVGSNSSIIEENVLRTIFMPDFIKAETMSLKVSGNMAADLETPYGEGRISGIKVENHIWQMKGLHGLDGGGKSKVIISNETVIGNIWTITLQIENPSDMFVDFGDTVFDAVQKRNSTGCIGTISVEKLTLDYGSNNVTGKFDLTAPHCNSSELAEFLSNFMNGGRNDLNLRTTSSHEVMGFTGLEIGAEWISPSYHLFDFIDLVIGEHNVMAKIGLKNPFDTVLTLDSVDIELVLADKVIAAITSQEHSKETVMGGQSVTLSGISLIPVNSIQELVETFQKELLSETSELMAITASGKIRLLLADYEAPLMNYKQENVEVKLRWEV